VLRRLLLILVFAIGLTGHSLAAEHSADASVPRHVATRSERVCGQSLPPLPSPLPGRQRV
jgi:hypothetical protein